MGRHGPTEWNELGLFQGRKDLPLSEKGRKLVQSWKLPSEFLSCAIYSSPLSRSIETAKLITGKEPIILEELTEIDYGKLEGTSVDAENKRRLQHGNMITWDSEDFGVESYRSVLNRTLSALSKINDDAVIICHRGILFTLTAWCWDWDFKAKKPHHLDPYGFQLFEFTPNQMANKKPLEILKLNIQPTIDPESV